MDGHHPPSGHHHLTAGDEASDHGGQLGHQVRLLPALRGLGDRLILFGEWCAARHSVGYDALPDWYLGFDLYDKESGRFWSGPRRDRLCAELGIALVPTLSEGAASLPTLTELVECHSSRFGPDAIEGVVIRRDDGDWLGARAKLVGPGFTQAIDTHWRSRSIVWNRLAA